MSNLITIFVVMAIVNNIVLAKFLGLCPFFGVSRKLSNAISMGMAVTLVMLISSVVTSVIYNYILVPLEIEFMQIVLYILVIASLVQIVELTIKRTNVSLYNALGIYLPLITTNCAVLGVALINSAESYTILESIASGLGGGIGFTLVLIIMSGIREKLDLADTPKSMKGLPIAFITAALLALAFMGFNGMM
ncbi:MAG: RnfABCDGE type electron transport complex subunit A [Actinomycetota bacterium]|nr:MAG: RnfABCDGE type electron transport complex subunit A [Actinomycetota bacterium]